MHCRAGTQCISATHLLLESCQITRSETQTHFSLKYFYFEMIRGNPRTCWRAYRLPWFQIILHNYTDCRHRSLSVSIQQMALMVGELLNLCYNYTHDPIWTSLIVAGPGSDCMESLIFQRFIGNFHHSN